LSGSGGAGIVGVAGGGITIINDGTITGGMSGDGVTQANAITFTGGNNALELQASSAISGDVVGTGSDTFRLGGSANASFDVSQVGASAQYRGFSTFEKIGTSTWTLTGSTAAVTPWTLKQGMLSISSDANLGASSAGLTFDGGTLQITSVANLASTRAITLNAGGGTFDIAGGITTFSQSFGGGGPVTFTNGLAALSAVNTYSGVTTITSNGTLAANTAGVLSPNSDFTVNGVLLLNGFDNTIKSLSGSGSVVNSAGAAPAVTLTIAPPSGVTTFSGTLSDGFGGPLSLVKAGAGTQVLSGINTYTGATTVNAGTLSVNGSIASSSLMTVNTGGTLGGTGTVGNTAINGGTLAPGNSIGTLTVQGNLVMTAASTYMVEVSPANSDFTHVTGTAALGGATVKASFAPGSYVEKRYTILTADGGVSGTFSGPVNTNLSTNFKSALAHDGNNAYLDLSLNFVMPGGLNANQTNVANTLVNAFNSNSGIPLAFGALDSRGLSLASGEVATTASQAAFDAQSQFLNTLTRPLTLGGQGVVSTSSPSQPMAYAGERKPHDAFAAMTTKAPPLQTFDQRWRIFGAAYGGNTQIGGNAALGSHDATSRVYGGIGGASYALSPATELGFAFGGGGTSFGLSDGLGSGRSEMFQAGVFAHHGFARGGYLSGAFAYGWHDVTTDRTASTGERLRGAYKAGVLSGRLEAGWRIDTAWAGVTPYAAAQAISYRMPSYLEQGNGAADSFALGYAGRDVTATRSELGLRLDRTTVMGETLLTLRGRAAWAHNFDTARNAAATFQSLPGTGFIVNGAAMAPDAALVSAGAEVAWRNGFALAATFEGEFSNNVTSYTGKGTLKYAW
jgi:autotransporter-associated beta strand protein